MQAPARGDRLIVWGLASFHTAFFMALLAMLLYLGGGLGTLLGSLNTLVGSLLIRLTIA